MLLIERSEYNPGAVVAAEGCLIIFLCVTETKPHDMFYVFMASLLFPC